jgi:hypothetical protein
VSDADVDAAASVLADALVVEAAQDAVAEELADEAYQEGWMADDDALVGNYEWKRQHGLILCEANDTRFIGRRLAINQRGHQGHAGLFTKHPGDW